MKIFNNWRQNYTQLGKISLETSDQADRNMFIFPVIF